MIIIAINRKKQNFVHLTVKPSQLSVARVTGERRTRNTGRDTIYFIDDYISTSEQDLYL